MIIHTMPQRSPEWFAIRDLKMSASHASTIAANGKGLVTYINTLAREHYSKVVPSFSNKHTERGIELEPHALCAYSMETGYEVMEVGFVEHSKHVGVSPDGLVGDDGLVEVKCPDDPVYFQLLLDDKIDPKYYAQMQMQMYVCERKWCDYVVYNPNFPTILVIKRVTPDQKVIDKLLAGFETGTNLIEELTTKLDAIFGEANAVGETRVEEVE